MRALILVLLFAGVIFSSCTKDKDPFDILPQNQAIENLLLDDEMWENEIVKPVDSQTDARYSEFSGNVLLKLHKRAQYRCPDSGDRLLFLGEGISMPFGDFEMGLTHCVTGVNYAEGKGIFAKNGDTKILFKYTGYGVRRGDGSVHIVADMTITSGRGIYGNASGSFRFEGTMYHKHDASSPTGTIVWINAGFTGNVTW
jgi:hypothetical protein